MFVLSIATFTFTFTLLSGLLLSCKVVPEGVEVLISSKPSSFYDIFLLLKRKRTKFLTDFGSAKRE